METAFLPELAVRIYFARGSIVTMGCGLHSSANLSASAICAPVSLAAAVNTADLQRKTGSVQALHIPLFPIRSNT